MGSIDFGTTHPLLIIFLKLPRVFLRSFRCRFRAYKNSECFGVIGNWGRWFSALMCAPCRRRHVKVRKSEGQTQKCFSRELRLFEFSHELQLQLLQAGWSFELLLRCKLAYSNHHTCYLGGSLIVLRGARRESKGMFMLKWNPFFYILPYSGQTSSLMIQGVSILTISKVSFAPIYSISSSVKGRRRK